MGIEVEQLAKELHEAGREAVEKGATVAADHHGEKTRKFLAWDEISENAREGRRIQARYLIGQFNISYRAEQPKETVAEAVRRGFSS